MTFKKPIEPIKFKWDYVYKAYVVGVTGAIISIVSLLYTDLRSQTKINTANISQNTRMLYNHEDRLVYLGSPTPTPVNQAPQSMTAGPATLPKILSATFYRNDTAK